MEPCPKCGNNKPYLQATTYSYIDYVIYRYVCKECGWKSPEQETEEKAYLLWQIFRPGRKNVCKE